jgi:magnesium chelatase subunit I
MQITEQEAKLTKDQMKRVTVPPFIRELIEMVAFEARENEYVDAKSGVSARLTITALENLVSSAERRCLINKEKKTHARISDLMAIVPAVTGKIELVYEGEQEGPQFVAMRLLGLAIRKKFPQLFPGPETIKRKKLQSPYAAIVEHINSTNIQLLNDWSRDEYANTLYSIPMLHEIVDKYCPGIGDEDRLMMMEFVLHGLAEYSVIGKTVLDSSIEFSDIMNDIFKPDNEEND